MTYRRLLSATLFFVVAALVLPTGSTPAAAQTAGCSGLDRQGTSCSIADGNTPPPPTPGGGPIIDTTSPPGPRFVWLNTLVPCDAGAGSNWASRDDLDIVISDGNLGSGDPPPDEPGVIWLGELIDPTRGRTNTGFVSCVGEGSALPALPPPLPTAGEIWGAALTFEPQINVDPYVRGLTGLETYLWYEGPTSDTVTITLNGYTVTAQIDVAEFRWDTGAESRDGNQSYASAAPGSAESPAATHLYALPANVVIVHEILWTGTSVVTGPGVPGSGVPIDLGQAVVSIARAYDVIEVRTPLVGR